MPEKKQYRVIEVDAPVVLEILVGLNPDFEEVTYEEMHEKFIVIGYPEAGHITTMSAEDIHEGFNHMTTGYRIKTLNLHEK